MGVTTLPVCPRLHVDPENDRKRFGRGRPKGTKIFFHFLSRRAAAGSTAFVSVWLVKQPNPTVKVARLFGKASAAAFAGPCGRFRRANESSARRSTQTDMTGRFHGIRASQTGDADARDKHVDEARVASQLICASSGSVKCSSGIKLALQ